VSVIAATQESSKDWKEALADLMEATEFSYRQLAKATKDVDPSGKGISHAYINMAVNSHDRITPHALRLIAQACKVRPSYFAEVRLQDYVKRFDPDEVGLDKALQNLNAAMGEKRGARRGKR